MMPLAVVLTGPECTGKTTLAERLTAAYHTAGSPEFARHYVDARLVDARLVDARLVDGNDVVLGPDDVAPIARGQIAGEEVAAAEAAARGRPLVVRDTDLVSTVVYARHYYGACPSWIEDAARTRRGALYLLCAPDVPWIADAVRDRPLARASMRDEFRAALAAFGCNYVEVSGAWAEREATARAAIDAVLAGQ